MRAPRALAALTLGLALALAGCGDRDNDTGSPQTSGDGHNDADVTFATDMIQHHAQALSMVDLTTGRPLDPQVEKLANDIRAAQAPAIEMMSDWLQEWGEEVPETMRDHAHAGDDMRDMSDDEMAGMDDLPGMMTQQEMAALEDASDAEFQDMWLEMMTEHHEGAVVMAETEQSDGSYELAVDLAGDIVSAQTAEIATMRRLVD